MTTGKTLAELRTEIELGLFVYPVPQGYCCITLEHSEGHSTQYSFSTVDGGYRTYDTFEEVLAYFAENVPEFTVWSTLDPNRTDEDPFIPPLPLKSAFLELPVDIDNSDDFYDL